MLEVKVVLISSASLSASAYSIKPTTASEPALGCLVKASIQPSFAVRPGTSAGGPHAWEFEVRTSKEVG